jgi:predicted TIM-barrel fold metal-dependent hydrolase
MKLPFEAPVRIVDPLIQLFLNKETLDIPVPKEAFRDDFSLERWPSPEVVSYLFKKTNLSETPEARATRAESDRIGSNLDLWIDQLDRNNMAMGGCGINADDPDWVFEQIQERSDRVFGHVRVNPHSGMRGIRRLNELAQKFSFIKSVAVSPYALYPFISPNSKELYPIYAKCVELDLAIFINVGVPGPRVPSWMQDPIHLDEVCWFFPDLRVIMRHGGEPWEDMCVKLMLRWPNLYYAPTAMAPRHYPKAIMHYLRTRGADKIMFAGYWPAFSYDQIFEQVSEFNLKPETWPLFLADNARRAFNLPTA